MRFSRLFFLHPFSFRNYALENRKEWEQKGEMIVKDMVEKIKAKKTNPPSPRRAVDKPTRRRSFGYFARRSATFMIALPKTPDRNESEKERSGEYESCDEDDESFELRLNNTGGAKPLNEIVPQNRIPIDKESKQAETTTVEETSFDCLEPASPAEQVTISVVPMKHVILNPAKNDNRSDTAPVEEVREYESEDDDSVIVDA